jgi:hypothetical protein
VLVSHASSTLESCACQLEWQAATCKKNTPQLHAPHPILYKLQQCHVAATCSARQQLRFAAMGLVVHVQHITVGGSWHAFLCTHTHTHTHTHKPLCCLCLFVVNQVSSRTTSMRDTSWRGEGREAYLATCWPTWPARLLGPS